MSTTAVHIPCDPKDHNILTALLMTDAVEGVEERDTEVILFMSEENWEAERERLQRISVKYATGPISTEQIEDQNWNAEWEKTIQPVQVGGFWIRPTWNDVPVPADHIEIIVDPKMSFGTGYHESTRLMMGAMREVVKKGHKVLDAGTGTGVLAFAALKLGAGHADAFDFDPICKENSEENAVLNGLSDRFSVTVGTETIVSGRNYDVILANINREALRAMLPALRSFLAPGGQVGLAGLLQTDREMMLGDFESMGMKVVREAREGEWWSVWISEEKA